MKLFEKLFGKWEKIETFPAVMVSTWILNGSKSEDSVSVVIERNSKSGKERGYCVYHNGAKSKVNPDWARDYLK